MSEPKPPVMPDDDRELEDFLARRSELSRLYRQDAAEIKAPDALDAAVLAAAQSSLPSAKAKQARLRRWRLPLSLAASTVIGIAVLREVPREPALPVASEVMAVAVEAPSQSPPAPAAAEMALPQTEAAPMPERAEARMKSAPLPQPPRVIPDAAITASPPALLEATKPEAYEPALRARSVAKAAAPLMAESEARADDAAWHPARYRGLQLGAVTVTEWQRRIGHPAVTSAPSGDARLAADATKSEAEQQLEYGPGVDPRGSLRAELDLQRQRVDTVILHLTPALPLRDVEQAEALPRAARQQSESALPFDQTACRKARASGPDQGRVATRVYPERGIELRLGEDGRVTEIRYLATRPEPGC